MPYAYKNATDDKNAYAEDGWELMPFQVTGGNIVAFKDITVPFVDVLVQSLLNRYESADWQKAAFAYPKLTEYYEKIGYRFVPVTDADTGKSHTGLALDEQTVSKLCSWRVEMDFSDGYLRLSPFDVTFPFSFYNKKLLEKYAGEIVAQAKSKGLIRCARISS